MFRKTVNFALQLYDDFNGRTILKGGHIFKVNDRIVTPIYKLEGFYVFCGLEGNVFNVNISGGKYLEENLVITPENYPSQSIPVRLYRRYQAGFSDCEYIEGVLKPGQTVFALKQSKTAMKLISVKKEDEQIKVALSGYFYTPAQQIRFMIGKEPNRECFITDMVQPDKSYNIYGSLKHNHKGGTPVWRAYASRCDDDGRYFIPVDKGEGALIKEVLFYEEGDEKWGCSYVTELR